MGCIFNRPEDNSSLDSGAFDMSLMKNTPLIFVSGDSGTGNYTASRTITNMMGYHMIVPSELARSEASKNTYRGRKIASILQENREIPEQTIFHLILEAMLANPSSQGFVVLGFPKSPEIARLFNKRVKYQEKETPLAADYDVSSAHLEAELVTATTNLGSFGDEPTASLVQKAAPIISKEQGNMGHNILPANRIGKKDDKELEEVNLESVKVTPQAQSMQ